MTTQKRHVVVAGAGGNTGSHLLPHLARMSEISRLTIVDDQFYEPANLSGAEYRSSRCRPAKGSAQAESGASPARLGEASLEVIALQERIEDVPRGLLKCDLIVSCLDSRVSRQSVNELAFRLDCHWIDCGVLSSQHLVRVSRMRPGTIAMFRVRLGAGRVFRARTKYPVRAERCGLSTMATSALGSLAASLMAIEIKNLLAGDEAPTRSPDAQIIFDAEHHVIQESVLRRNPYCRFDHRSCEIEPWVCPPEATTVGAALSALGSLQVEGHRSRGVGLPRLRPHEKSLRLNRPLARCPACDRRMVTAGFGSLDRIDSTLAGEYANFTLAQIGLRAGDIVSGNEARHHRVLEAA